MIINADSTVDEIAAAAEAEVVTDPKMAHMIRVVLQNRDADEETFRHLLTLAMAAAWLEGFKSFVKGRP